MQSAGSASASVATIVPVQSRPQAENGFPGLYATSLPDQLFLEPELALLTTQWANTLVVAAADLSGSSVSPWFTAEHAPAADGSRALLSAYKGKKFSCVPCQSHNNLT